MRSLIIVCIFVVQIAGIAIGFADTIHVPGGQSTIQAGINAAMIGDTVLVASGTYVENIDFFGRAITLKSEQGPVVTVINGNQAGSVVTFVSGEGPDSILEGFTITNGSGTYYDDYWEYGGGGIFCDGSSPTIRQNTITGNSANNGGGIALLNGCAAVITENSISANSANVVPGRIGGGGGIVAAFESDPLISFNDIYDNQSLVAGGGMACGFDCDPQVLNNTIHDNMASVYGGGIQIYSGTAGTFENNVITGNTSLGVNGAGGISCRLNSTPVISNNLIAGNSAATIGGGMRCFEGSTPTLINNLIHGNTADQAGGGIRCDSGASATITNTVLWSNTAPSGTEIWIGPGSGAAADLTISYSNVEGGMAAVFVALGSTLNWGSGMIEEDPVFVSGPGGDYYLSQVAAGQPADSPCVDAGRPLTFMAGTTRTDGHPDTGVVDMGYHYPLLETVSADLACVPDVGILPFALQFSVTLRNAVANSRRVAGRIDVTLAGGVSFTNWRAGFTNLDPDETLDVSWQQTFPALGNLVGVNVFELHAEDVTPAPWNQSPYPPAGDTDTDMCTVTGVAP